jgi:hypothetical protein
MKRNGSTGMAAPIANIANDDPAAASGEPRSSGSSPSSSRTSVSSACSGFLSSSAAVRLACSVESPFCLKMSASSAASSSGASSTSRRSSAICRARRSRWLATDVYSPTAIEQAPARRPASPVTTSVRGSSTAPATPRTSERFDTSPSFMPKIAARMELPRPPRCHRSRCAMSARASCGCDLPMPASTSRCSRSSSASAAASPPCCWYFSASFPSVSSTSGSTAAVPRRRASQMSTRMRELGASGGSAAPAFSSLRAQISAWRRSPAASSRKERARAGSRSTAASPSYRAAPSRSSRRFWSHRSVRGSICRG